MPVFYFLTSIMIALIGGGVYMSKTYTPPPPPVAIEDTASPGVPLPVVQNVAGATSAPLPATPSQASSAPVATVPPVKIVANSATRKVVRGAQKLAMPAGLVATPVSETQINLSWKPTAGAAGYKIYRNSVEIGTSIDASYADIDISPSDIYAYVVVAQDVSGKASPPSGNVFVSKREILIALQSAPPASVDPAPVAATPAPSTASSPVVTTTTVVTKPAPVQTTTVVATAPVCQESWGCSAWSACSGGTQSRTCTDANACGTATSKPALTQGCTMPVVAAPPPPAPTPAAACGSGGPCTAADIAPHNTAADCWVYLSPINKAYNISPFTTDPNLHPNIGPGVIIPYCGGNIYGPFIQGTGGGKRHSSTALNVILQAYYIGAFQ